MSSKLRFILLWLNIAMIFALIEVRQASQLAFSDLQELEKLHRMENQVLNQIKLNYLKALNAVPSQAWGKGFIQRETRDEF
jgi:hypothetical protein